MIIFISYYDLGVFSETVLSLTVYHVITFIMYSPISIAYV